MEADADSELRKAELRLYEDLVESADFLELLRSDEPSDEFVYHLSAHCDVYIDYVDRLRERGAPFSLPPADELEGGPFAAAIGRLGQQPRVDPLDEGAPGYWEGDDSRLAQTQKRDCFPVAAAQRLEQACFSWLYDHAPHVMACLDRVRDGVSALMMSCTVCLTDRSACSLMMRHSGGIYGGSGELYRGRRVRRCCAPEA